MMGCGRETYLFLLVSILVIFSVCDAGKNKKISTALKNNYYGTSCPLAEKIVEDIMKTKVKTDPLVGAKLLRMHYHDCFVRGCDASILLDGPDTEKVVIPLEGYEVVDEIKANLEKVCPRVVSCSDILALAARDGVSQVSKRLKRWEVLTGRRDGRISRAADIDGNMPAPSLNFTQLMNIILNKGLDKKDLVVLSGAHTVGVAHCGSFSDRLYNFTGAGDSDPSLDRNYAQFLRKQCPKKANPKTVVEMDPGSSVTFGNHYYTAVRQKKGLFHSDASLMMDKEAARIVRRLEKSNTFFKEFVNSMKKMGGMELLTGTAGEIRTNCRFVNN